MKTRSLILSIAVMGVSALLISSSPAFSKIDNGSSLSSQEITMENGYYKAVEDSRPPIVNKSNGRLKLIKGPK